MAESSAGQGRETQALAVLEAVGQLEELRLSLTYACEEAAVLTTTNSGRAKFSLLIQALDKRLNAIKTSWPAVVPALQLAGQLSSQRRQQQQLAAQQPGQGGQNGLGRAVQAHCRAVSLKLEECIDQALLDCYAKRLTPDALLASNSPAAPAAPPLAGHAPATVPAASAPDLVELHAVVERVRAAGAGLDIHLMGPQGNFITDSRIPSHLDSRALPVELRAMCPKVFCASLVLVRPGYAGLLRVTVDCVDKAPDMEPWTTPSLQVFRRLTALATRVHTYLTKRAPAALAAGCLPNAHPDSCALEDMLLWLATYKDLFSRRCAATNRLLAWDPSMQYPVPPIFRPYKLPRWELRSLAANPALVTAYHMHAAPQHLLGWEETLPAALEHTQ